VYRLIAFCPNEACRRQVLVDVSNYLARTGYAGNRLHRLA
jgi:hypothetical protein